MGHQDCLADHLYLILSSFVFLSFFLFCRHRAEFMSSMGIDKWYLDLGSFYSLFSFLDLDKEITVGQYMTYGTICYSYIGNYHLCYTKQAVGGVSHLGQDFPQPKVSSNLAFKLWMIRGTNVDWGCRFIPFPARSKQSVTLWGRRLPRYPWILYNQYHFSLSLSFFFLPLHPDSCS